MDNDEVRAKDGEVSKINKPSRNELADTSKVVKEALNKCGDCGKTVLKKDNGVLSEVCDSWFHTTCQKVSEETYKFYWSKKQFIGCNRSVKQVLATMTEMRIEMTSVQNEIKTIKK